MTRVRYTAMWTLSAAVGIVIWVLLHLHSNVSGAPRPHPLRTVFITAREHARMAADNQPLTRSEEP